MAHDRHNDLNRLLAGLLGRTRRRVALYGALAVSGWGGGALVTAAWVVGGAQAPSLSALWGLSASVLLVLAALGLRRLVAPLRGLAGEDVLVRRIEARGPHANLLVAAEESLRRADRWSEDTPTRRELARRVRDRAVAQLQGLGPDDVIDLPRRRWHTAAAAATLAAVLILGAVRPDELARGLGRLAAPWSSRPAVPTAGILSLGSPSWVVAGADVRLEALDLAAGPGPALCEVRRGEGLWQPLEADLARDSRRSPGRLWSVELADVHEDFRWRYRRGSIVSPERAVVVRDHPLLANLGVTVTPPAYTRGEPRTLDRLPAWIEVPVGSRVDLLGEANGELAQAVLFDGSDSTVLSVAGARVAGSLRADRDVAFRIHLTDVWGLRNLAPLGYEIAATPDQVPAVALERPDDDGLLPLEGELTLVLDAADDYGIAELRLLGRVDGREEWAGGSLHLAEPGRWSEHALGAGLLRARVTILEGHGLPVRARCRVDVEVGELALAAGSALELVAEALDNRQPGPPGVARSRALRFQVPSPADVLARQDESQEERRSELAEMRRRSRELDKDLDRLTRELMKNPVPDWGRQQEMEEALRRQQTLQKELSRVADELRRELEDLAASQLTSQEQLERADEVAALLDAQGDRELADLMQKLEQNADQVDPRDLAQALRDVTRDQKDLARRLDAALAMLERMSREQELESMAALLEQLLRRQQELADLSRELAAGQQEAAADSTGAAAEDEPADPSAPGEEGERPPQESPSDPARPQGEEQANADTPSDPAESREGETPDAEELARRQEALARELEELRDRLADAVEEMQRRQQEGEESPGSEQTREALEQALAELEQQLEQGRMDQASQSLQEMDPETAAQMQQQAMRDLGSLYHVLLETQQAMQMAMQMNQVTSLRRLAADLLEISARQETIADDVPTQIRDVRTRGLTRSQNRLQKATIGVRDQLAELMQEAPTRIMRLLDKLDGLIEEMGYGVRALEDGRAAVARRHTRESLAQANRTIIGLLTEANMTMQGMGGGNSSTPSDAAQQLQEMAREQAKLNGLTEQLREMLANRGMSQEARAQMERLGQAQADQANRARELEEQERERPDGERLLGDLQAMGEDLEGIARELDSGLVSEETLVRQERILSRMLDARNAARRRDFSTRRESRTAEEIFGDPGFAAGPDARDDERRARLRYQPLEKAPLEYRDLVRRYFAGLDSLRRLDPPPAGDGAGGGLP